MLTELLLDHLKDLLLIKLLGETLDRGQGLTTIALCKDESAIYRWMAQGQRMGHRRTLNPNMDVVLRLLRLPCVFVCFGEGVCQNGDLSITGTPPS